MQLKDSHSSVYNVAASVMNFMHTQAGLLLAVLLISGCEHFHVNERLAPPASYATDAPRERYEYDASDTGTMTVALSLSGGGARAAAFSYGVIKALEQIEIGPELSLLDEVDIVSSVSGGSITAAYWAAHGRDRLFSHFPQQFLFKNVESELFFKFISPSNRFRLLGQTFERVDLMAEYVDEELFDAKKTTFEQVRQNYAGRNESGPPFFVLSATDISRGTRFGFTQESFDQLCSNLNSYPLSRAIAASAAVPAVSSPITLQNFNGFNCHLREPDWVNTILDSDDQSILPADLRRARAIRSYRDETRVSWVHLFDGGLADNLGVQGLYDVAFRTDRACTPSERQSVAEMNELLLIVVDTMPDLGHEADLEKIGPELSETMSNAFSIPMDRLSELTFATIPTRLASWVNHCGGNPDDVRIRRILVRIPFLEGQQNITKLDKLSKAATRLSLDAETVELLCAAGRDAIIMAPEIKQLIEERAAGSAPRNNSSFLNSTCLPANISADG